MLQIIDYLTVRKKPWSDLTEQEKKSFNVFIINRVLSMHPDLVEISNYFQRYINMPVDVCYNIWLRILPNKRLTFDFIKKTNVKKDIAFISEVSLFYSISRREAEEYIDILKKI